MFVCLKYYNLDFKFEHFASNNKIIFCCHNHKNKKEISFCQFYSLTKTNFFFSSTKTPSRFVFSCDQNMLLSFSVKKSLRQKAFHVYTIKFQKD